MNTTTFKHIAHCWAALIAEELFRLGVENICIAPGSRSTPLVMAFAEHKGLICHTHFDERSLGFYALGLAKSSEKPVVILTTSGSAVANLLPAIVEAFHSNIPLLILSSDRAYSQHYHGENQTISQQFMFGQFVKLFQNIPPSSSSILPEWLLATIDEAYFKMTSSDKGPVHLNVMVEEPFFQKEQSYSTYLNHISGWLSSNTPIKVILPTKTTLLTPAKQQLTLKNVIAVVGHIENSQDADLIAAFCKDKQIPVLTECHSKLFGYPDTIHCVDLFLNNLNDQLGEDYTVLFFGHQLVSKTCIQFLKHAKTLIHVTTHQRSTNPTLTSQLTLKCPYIDAIDSLKTISISNSKKWLKTIIDVQKTTQSTLANTTFNSLSELSVLNSLCAQLDSSSLIFVANSLCVRIINNYVSSKKQHIIYANRGASGIDGNLSTAIGIAKDQNKPLYFICGDLTFLYDLNALILLQQTGVCIKIILLNNNGGKIFTFLPVKEHFDQLNPYFTTPHHLTMSHLAKQFNLSYDTVSDKSFSDLNKLIKKHIHNKSASLLECNFDEKNTKKQIKSLSKSFL